MDLKHSSELNVRRGGHRCTNCSYIEVCDNDILYIKRNRHRGKERERIIKPRECRQIETEVYSTEVCRLQNRAIDKQRVRDKHTGTEANVRGIPIVIHNFNLR
jgi:hypothetical protein